MKASIPLQAQAITSFTGLFSWQEAHKLVIMIYNITKKFPTEERFGLTNQLRRAAVSISSNIAEGFSRKSDKEKIQFYYQALGSLTEIQNQILIAKDIQYVHHDEFEPLAKQTVLVSKLINGLIKKIKQTKSSA